MVNDDNFLVVWSEITSNGRLRVTDRYNNKGYRFSQTTYNVKKGVDKEL